ALCEIFKNTQCTIIKSAIENQKVCYGVKLKNFSGLLGSKFCGISKEPRLGKEISQYVKTGTKLRGLFHSDELPNYGISEDEIKEVRKILSCCESDAFILLTGNTEDVLKGMKIAVERVKMTLSGVPEETRKATGEETEYMRPLPGASRMYPETDVAMIETDAKFIEKVRKNLPELIDSKFERYASMVGKELANQLIHSKISVIFDKFAVLRMLKMWLMGCFKIFKFKHLRHKIRHILNGIHTFVKRYFRKNFKPLPRVSHI
ncbi:MAG: hypothetical protein CVT89_02225, partial [Candidatus Altiarchaeales archaeon HGW-Altiarchaeales-2]